MTKAIAASLAVIFLSLFVLTTFVPYPPAIERARAAEFSGEEIETGLQYTFERRLLMWAAQALELALLCAFALTSVARRLADRCLFWSGNRRAIAALLVGACFWVVHEVLYLPIGVARLSHAHAWGMSNLSVLDWLRDHAIAQSVEAVAGAIMVLGLYSLLIWLPRTWWLVAPLGAGLLAAAFAFLMPLVISPLFNDFTPLEKTQWADQQPRVQSLISRAGVPVQEILVMNASRQSNHSNAYFAGFGPTRRIVLYDTLLKNHSPDEIESVLAHELGHWQHDHIVQGILLGILGALVGCYVLHRALRMTLGREPWFLQSIADPAGLPLIMLLVFLGGWFVAPAANLVSRHFERQADQTSLELADLPKAFIDAERNLARVNKGNVAPTPWNVWLFASHPPTVERIRMAEDWRKR